MPEQFLRGTTTAQAAARPLVAEATSIPLSPLATVSLPSGGFSRRPSAGVGPFVERAIP